MIYSASRLETYRQCPQKFKFTYIDQIESPHEGIEAFMGSRVHEALQQLYTDVRFLKSVPLENLLRYYRHQWDTKWHDAVQIVRDEMTPDNYLKIGEKCLSDYYQRYAPFDETKTLGVEYPVRFSLDEAGQYKMQGYIDRLSQSDDGVIRIHDYKAKSFFPTQMDLDMDRQLAYYQIAVQKLWPDVKTIELVWHYLIFDREFRSRRDQKALDHLQQETIVLIETIEGATSFPPKESALCNWCEHRAICPLFRHLYEVQALTPTEYAENTGANLVEKLVELQAKEGAVKMEIENVKDALRDYAQKKKIETVYSKTYKVLIRVYDNLRFPGKNDPGRTILEKVVKESGKYDAVSTLDTFVLSKSLQTDHWDEAVASRISKLGVSHKTIWTKVSRRSGLK